MWFVILPVVMSIGTIATIIANYTPVFEIIGKPFIPILQLLQIPEAKSIRNFTYWFCRYVFTFYLNSDGTQ